MKTVISKRIGFTLVELLVVVAIIAILAGLVAPGIARAKSRAATIQCLNNFKQLNLGWQMYAVENDDVLGSNNAVKIADGATDKQLAGLSWALVDPTEAGIKGGYLFEYNGDIRIYSCPADKNPGGLTPLPERKRSYTMSQSVNGYPEYDAFVFKNIPMFKKLTDIRSPNVDRCLVFIDEDENTIMDSLFGIPTEKFNPNREEEWWSLPSNRHNQAANLSFADGHAETFHWRVAKTYQSWPQQTVQGESPDWKRVSACIKQY
jgi:prepilin-type N-terminal cleavage/methylation domain-containing protein/prepilin-type processing-associated H-X9-DG protein